MKRPLKEVMAEATQGDWHQCRGDGWHIIRDARHMLVCRASALVKTRPAIGERQEKANAALIVHEHNTYAELVEALKNMLDASPSTPASVAVPAANALAAAQEVEVEP